MSETKQNITFDNSGTITVPNQKKIDFDEVGGIEDVINLLEVMDLRIYDNGDEKFDKIRHLLIDEE